MSHLKVRRYANDSFIHYSVNDDDLKKSDRSILRVMDGGDDSPSKGVAVQRSRSVFLAEPPHVKVFVLKKPIFQGAAALFYGITDRL